MSLVCILTQLFIFKTYTTKSCKNISDPIDLIIKSGKICDVLNTKFNETGLSFETVQSFGESMWYAVINHEIFINMTKNIIMKADFSQRLINLKNAYLEMIRGIFITSTWNSTIIDLIPANDQHFIDELIYGTLEYYNMLLMCYKDRILSSNCIKDAIEEIIRQNTCYIKNGTEKFPSLVFKICKGLIPHFKECYKDKGMEYIYNEIKYNQDQLLRAECINNSNYDVSNIKNITDIFTYDFLNVNYDNKVAENDTGTVPLISKWGFLILMCLGLLLLGWVYYKKRIRKKIQYTTVYNIY
ncbi:putative SP-containing membrane protein [Vairimorpha necatrix]|uniref:SP-containing membrane protein n=1 Tax=Vairimorpha necatrix TaxID=6039 RepID=A0AAX4JCE0_9MICR